MVSIIHGQMRSVLFSYRFTVIFQGDYFNEISYCTILMETCVCGCCSFCCCTLFRLVALSPHRSQALAHWVHLFLPEQRFVTSLCEQPHRISTGAVVASETQYAYPTLMARQMGLTFGDAPEQ